MVSLEKFDYIKEFLVVYSGDIDVVVIGETWVKESYQSLYYINGYNGIFSCRPDSMGGGLAVYVKKSLSYEEIQNVHSDGMHHIHLSFNINGSGFNIHAMYRPPSFDVSLFLNKLDSILSSIKCDQSCVIVGDVNIPINQENNNVVEEYLNVLNCYNYAVTNTYVTRPRSNNNLDHVVCSESLWAIVRNETIFTDISDHSLVLSTFDISKKVNSCTLEKTIVNHAKLNENFIAAVRDFPHGSADQKLQHVISVYRELKEKCSRKVTIQAKVKGACPWMTVDVWKLMQIKDKILTRKKRCPTDVSLQDQLKHVSKKLQHAKQQSKKTYYSNLLQSCNSKNMWKILNHAAGRVTENSQKIELESCDYSTGNDNDVADIFNDFFSRIGPQLASTINSQQEINRFGTLRPVQNSIFLQPASQQEVIIEIKNLDSSKSCGPDEISVRFLKIHHIFFSKLLTDVFNEVIDTGVYPDCLKTARVIPIYKSGTRKDPSNYRPISVLSVLSKILERLLVRRLVDFLNQNNLLYSSQYGFRQGASSLTATSELVDELYEAIDMRKLAGVLFLDLKKAFDTIDHGILLRKLDNYGVRGIANELIKSFLTDRRQYVTVNNISSKCNFLRVGVPQGSNLGPLMFLLYINDLSNLRLNGKPRLFADDTSLSYVATNGEQIVNNMKEDLRILQLYFRENLLSLNLSKTKYMLFHSSRQNITVAPQLIVNSVEIEKADSFKYLGLIMDPTLSWENHISMIQKSIGGTCGLIWKMSKFLPSRQLLILYHALVQSRLCYLVSIWGAASKARMKLVQTIQNRCLKIIYKKPRLFPTVDLYKMAAPTILPVAALRDLQTVVQIHNLLHNPSALHNQSFPRPSHRYETRYLPALTVRRTNTNIGKRTYAFYGRLKYNSLPITIRSVQTITRFKNIVTTWIKTHIESYIL